MKISVQYNDFGDSYVRVLFEETEPHGPEDRKRFAMLACAASELLASCKLLVALEDGDVSSADTRWKQARKDMRAAIAKAEGRDE